MNDVVTKHSHLEKIKAHFRRNKKIYIGVGIGVVVGVGVGVVGSRYLHNNQKVISFLSKTGIVSRKMRDVSSLTADNSQAIVNSTLNNSPVTHVVTNTVNNVTNYVKHLGYNSKVVWPDGSEKWFETQSEVSRDLGISESRISRHINHGEPLEGGIQVFRMGVRLANAFA